MHSLSSFGHWSYQKLSLTAPFLATAVHASAAIALAYFIFDSWPCGNYWYIFGFCSAFPAVTEIFVMIGVLAFNKGI